MWETTSWVIATWAVLSQVSRKDFNDFSFSFFSSVLGSRDKKEKKSLLKRQVKSSEDIIKHSWPFWTRGKKHCDLESWRKKKIQPSTLDAQGRRSAFFKQQWHKSLLQKDSTETVWQLLGCAESSHIPSETDGVTWDTGRFVQTAATFKDQAEPSPPSAIEGPALICCWVA